MDPQDQIGQEGVKKNLHPLWHPGSNLSRPARKQASCRLSYLAHISIMSWAAREVTLSEEPVT